MITRIEAENYRCFRSLRVNLTEYQVIIGVNGAGKSTLLDIPVALGELLSRPVGEVFADRCYGMDELLHFGKADKQLGDAFLLAVEATIPDDIRTTLEGFTRPSDLQHLDRLRWELLVTLNDRRFLAIDTERVWLLGHADGAEPAPVGNGLTEPGTQPGKFQILERTGQSAGAWLSFLVETPKPGVGKRGRPAKSVEQDVTQGTATRDASYPVDAGRVAMAQIPISGELGTAVQWLREMFAQKAVVYDPDPRILSEPRPGDRPDNVQEDAGNFPWLLLGMQDALKSTATYQKENRSTKTNENANAVSTFVRGDALHEWLGHVRTALPNIVSIIAHRERGGRKAYIEVTYQGAPGHVFAVTSNSLSAGTWRLLTLTFLAYQSQPRPLVIGIEEPETALHPLAISTVLDSLRSLYGSQVMVATHAPMVLAKTDIDDIVVLSRDSSGAVTALRGREHPALATWKKGAPLSVLMASSVLS